MKPLPRGERGERISTGKGGNRSLRALRLQRRCCIAKKGSPKSHDLPGQVPAPCEVYVVEIALLKLITAGRTQHRTTNNVRLVPGTNTRAHGKVAWEILVLATKQYETAPKFKAHLESAAARVQGEDFRGSQHTKTISNTNGKDFGMKPPKTVLTTHPQRSSTEKKQTRHSFFGLCSSKTSAPSKQRKRTSLPRLSGTSGRVQSMGDAAQTHESESKGLALSSRSSSS